MISPAPKVGSTGWIGLTVADAPKLRDFDSVVVGWKPTAVPMGPYADYSMNDATSREPRAGTRRQRGVVVIEDPSSAVCALYQG